MEGIALNVCPKSIIHSNMKWNFHCLSSTKSTRFFGSTQSSDANDTCVFVVFGILHFTFAASNRHIREFVNESILSLFMMVSIPIPNSMVMPMNFHRFALLDILQIILIHWKYFQFANMAFAGSSLCDEFVLFYITTYISWSVQSGRFHGKNTENQQKKSERNEFDILKSPFTLLDNHFASLEIEKCHLLHICVDWECESVVDFPRNRTSSVNAIIKIAMHLNCSLTMAEFCIHVHGKLLGTLSILIIIVCFCMFHSTLDEPRVNSKYQVHLRDKECWSKNLDYVGNKSDNITHQKILSWDVLCHIWCVRLDVWIE